MNAVPQQVGERATDAGTAALVLHGLCRRFGDKLVVGGLDLELHAGERVALHGPNGSGKTTILRCVAGTLAPTSGTVTVCGRRAGSVAAQRLTGLKRRLFVAEVTLQLCGGNARRAERRFCWGRETVSKGLHELF